MSIEPDIFNIRDKNWSHIRIRKRARWFDTGDGTYLERWIFVRMLIRAVQLSYRVVDTQADTIPRKSAFFNNNNYFSACWFDIMLQYNNHPMPCIRIKCELFKRRANTVYLYILSCTWYSLGGHQDINDDDDDDDANDYTAMPFKTWNKTKHTNPYSFQFFSFSISISSSHQNAVRVFWAFKHKMIYKWSYIQRYLSLSFSLSFSFANLIFV